MEDCTKRIKELHPDTGELSYVETAAFTAVIGQKRGNQSLKFVLYCSGIPVQDQHRFIESSHLIKQCRHLNLVKLSLN